MYIYIYNIYIYIYIYKHTYIHIYISTKTQTCFKIAYLFMIYERFQSYSHLPHQVANNGINCYDTKLSKCPKILERNYVNIYIAIDNE